MSLTRRHALQAVGAAGVLALAGCTTESLVGDDRPTTEYALRVDSIPASPVEHALYEPGDDPVFGQPARAALDAVLPDGRYTTYGYQAVSSDRYVVHEGRYYQTKHVVTGREPIERTVVRVEPIPDDAELADEPLLVDALDQPGSRALKILHSDVQTDGRGGSADVLQSGGYVLRRPAERESRLAGDLDGRAVTMKRGGPWRYRVRTSRERLLEPAHTVFAVRVADSRAAFREVVFASRVDAELAADDLSADADAVLGDAIAKGTYRETAPLSAAFVALLDALDLRGVDRMANGRLLWYDDSLYRYALYIREEDE